jgi:hypothetical protein
MVHLHQLLLLKVPLSENQPKKKANIKKVFKEKWVAQFP